MANPYNKFAVAVITDSQMVGRTPSENIFTDHVVFCYMKRLCHVLSDVCHITGSRKKGKGLEVPCKYYEATKDPVFIFVIMLVPLSTKRDQAFI